MAQATKFFKDGKLGSELHQWRQELTSAREDKRKDAVKKIIAAMTIGKDVSGLFKDVLNCMATNNIELRKLVYLYVMNYAKTQPDKAFEGVSTFTRDCRDQNPLVRALAIRTLGSIRTPKIVEQLSDPLKNALKDGDPYVRKTAAICVAKLYDINPEFTIKQGFVGLLNDLISDPNQMVISNAVATLTEIDELSEQEIFQINTHNLNKLLLALDAVTEWGQVYILSALSRYTAKDSKEAELICERILPRLSHANSAVVLATVKLCLFNMEIIENEAVIGNLCSKMSPPLVSLLSKESEIQYVALRNINFIIQRWPQILQFEMKIFFCKYNDPIYVKMEKLEVMIILVTERTILEVLGEFKEYATEVDVDFVRRAVRAIGRAAIKLEKAADKCIEVLLELIQTKVNYVVQEAIIVIRDIFRRYPGQYETIIGTLCDNLDTLDEPEAKASMIWIIGEYAERIDNADELLDAFLENFQDENPAVQLQLLTSTVKLFLKRPKDTQEMVQNVLNLATQETDNPDLRDRGFIYWRLLSTDPEAAKVVVLSEKPLISDNISLLDDALLDELVHNISTLASVYHKPPQNFIIKAKPQVFQSGKKNIKKEKKTKKTKKTKKEEDLGGSSEGALISLEDTSPSPVKELEGLSIGQSASSNLPIVLTSQAGQGMQIAGAFSRSGGQMYFNMTVTNNSQAPISEVAFQFNTNTFQVAPASQPPQQQIAPYSSANISILLSCSGAPVNTYSTTINIAVKNNISVYYFDMQIPVHVVFTETGALEKGQFLELWKSLPETNEHTSTYRFSAPLESIVAKLRSANLFEIAQRQVDALTMVYLSAITESGKNFLFEFTFTQPQVGQIKVAAKTEHPELAALFHESVEPFLN